jgi:membrane-associated protease RseP (regulator of RpoE activity)
MKRSLVMCLSGLLACSSVAMASLRYDYDQQTPERPRRVELPSFLGVELSEVSRETVARLKLREERGALIEGVTSGSSAARAGLQKNDVIVKWDGEPIESAREMSRHIRETPAGRAVRLSVMRDGREIEVSVTLGERTALANRVSIARPAIASVRVRPEVQQVRPRLQDRGHLGVELQGMTPQLAEYFGLSKRSGALVIFVFADSPAFKAGLKAGDVILSAGGETVENPQDVRRALTDKSEGAIEFKILRDKQEQTLKVQLEKGTSSWLLAPDDCAETVVRAAIAPMVIQIPKMKIALAAIAVPRMALAPMVIQLPKMKMAPLALPALKIDLAPMKVEVPKIKIPPVNVVIVPRRVIL